MLRYANRSIFSQMEERPQYCVKNANNVSDPDGFKATLLSVLNYLVKRAVSVSSSKMFAVGDVELTVSTRLYVLVQCTPDLSPSDCQTCLSGCIGQIPECCDGKQGGLVLKPSSNIRFEIYPFYEPAAAALGLSPPATSSALPPAMATSANSSGNSSRRTIVIVVATVVSVMLFSTMCYCFVSWKARKNYNAIKHENGKETPPRAPPRPAGGG
ncbi:hypothetical protein L1049_007346 [Liquidambar formosana]|uniref:Gnk2-homologous domain-containing protein n=1 Tax=Liquidambar formosana TaxID=63359 RepID=A0AAP0N655_LIQFO